MSRWPGIDHHPHHEDDAPLPEDERTHAIPAGPGPPRLLGDRYEVIAVVGSGASAVTWRGHDRRLDRRVAIKILRREGEQDSAYVQRFEREARTSASISHGHVVNVYDVGQEDGWLYLVMQFVDGEDLKHMIARRGPLPVEEALEIARQILDGLAAIHGADILHRDIKPQNVLVDREGVVRVTDFGIAQAAADVGLTMAGTAVGTAAYMAPEQARAEPLSEATDIYAVGVVLYEMITGDVPFDRPTAMATMLAHVQEEPVPPSRRAPGAGIPAWLDGIVLQAMAKRPEDRFRSATAMARALGGNLDDPGATTRIAPVTERTRVVPAAARNRAWSVAARAPVAQPSPPTPRPAVASPGGRGLLNAVLVLILLAMTVVAAYTYYEYTSSRDNDDEVPPTAPVEEVIPTQPAAATDVPVILPPDDAEPDPTEPPPTDEPEPTLEPTSEPAAEPTDVPIEPAAGTGPGSDAPGNQPTENGDPIIEPEGGG